MEFSELYRRMNSRVSPDPVLKAEVLQRAEGAKRAKRKRRPALALAVLLACLIAVGAPVCVLAAENPAFNAMLYEVSPALAQFLKPVNLSCEDNGIRLEVESAAVEGDTAQVYLTLRDLIGNRIDETVDLNDSARIREAYDSINNCRLVEYDPETKTARFLLTSTNMNGADITGSKITFAASSFLSRKTKYEDVAIPMDWDALPQESPSMEAYYAGGSSEAQPEGESQMVRVLQPGEPREWTVKGIDLTGVGFVDGKLHLQTIVENNVQKDNHGYFWLEDGEGNRVEDAYSTGFYLDEHYETTSRTDFVFDISREELKNYTLHGCFWTSGLYTEGDWEVTFPVE